MSSEYAELLHDHLDIYVPFYIELIRIDGADLRGESSAWLDAMPQLRSISLVNCTLSDQWCNDISRLGALDDLSVEGCRLSESNTAVLARIPNLGSIDLSGNSVTDKHCAILANVNTVTSVSLNNTEVGDNGVSVLLKSCRLVSLSLAGTNLSNVSQIELASQVELRVLDLSSTGCDDNLLGCIARLRRLEIFVGGGGNFSLNELVKLKCQRPEITVLGGLDEEVVSCVR